MQSNNFQFTIFNQFPMIQFSTKKKRKYQSAITRRIYRAIGKIGICVLMVAFFAPLMAMQGTNAGFLDEEKSSGDAVNTGTLDIKASEKYFSYTTGTAPMEPGDEITQEAEIENAGSLDFQYKAQYINTNDSDLCDEIGLIAKLNGTKVYDSKLKDFDTSLISSLALNLNTAGKDSWEFKYSLPADADSGVENKECKFNYKFTAWQTDFPNKSLGFWDEDMLDPGASVEIESGEWASAGDILINEIMWMGSLSSSSDEWIELRNMTDEDINIKNWNIYGAVSGSAGHLEIAGNVDDNYVIPAHGFYLIANKKSDHSDINNKISVDLAKTSLNFDDDYDDNGQIVLKDKTGKAIDETPVPTGKKWPAGIHGIFFEGGIFHMSMQRKDIPGDGLSGSDWQTCVNANCRSNDYWDDINLFNYGTPKAPNLSPVVINEFVPNPVGDDGAGKPKGEWAELYNISNINLDASGWYFKNGAGNKVEISTSNTGSGNTIVPGNGRLVVYFERAFLNNDNDSLYLYSDMGTPGDDSDDVREDAYAYKNAGFLPEGKSFARFPEGIGIWIDPEATPGEENKLEKKEKSGFQLLTYEKCFDGEKLKKNNDEEVCAPVFLEYIDMLKDSDDEKIKEETMLEIVKMKEEEKKKELEALLKDAEKMVAGGSVPADTNILEPEQNTTAESNSAVSDTGGMDDLGAEVEIKKEEPDNTITNEINDKV
jgi:hypothetical protein